MAVEKNGYQYYDWNGRPIRVKDRKIEDYVGSGSWIPSRLTYAEIMKPGGDLTHMRDEAELQQMMAAVDKTGADAAK
jgi:hypothetical protein